MTLADHNDRLAALEGQVLLYDYFYINPSQESVAASTYYCDYSF